MENNSLEEFNNYQYIIRNLIISLADIITNNIPYDIEVIPINNNTESDFCYGHLKVDNLHFKTNGSTLILEENDMLKECKYQGELFNWIIGMFIYLKERNLFKDFKEFYTF